MSTQSGAQIGEVYIYKGEKVMITRSSSAARTYRYKIPREGYNISKTEDKAVFDASARLYAPQIKRGDIYKAEYVYVKILSIVAVEDKIRYETLNRRLPDTTSSFYDFTRRFSFVAREMRLGDLYKKYEQYYYSVSLNPLHYKNLFRNDDSISIDPIDVFKTWEFQQSGPREGEEWRSQLRGTTRTVEEVIDGGSLEVDLSNLVDNPPMWSFLREYKPLKKTKLPWNAPAAPAPAAPAPATYPDGQSIQLGDKVWIRAPGNTIVNGVVTKILPGEVGIRAGEEDLSYELEGLRITLKLRAAKYPDEQLIQVGDEVQINDLLGEMDGKTGKVTTIYTREDASRNTVNVDIDGTSTEWKPRQLILLSRTLVAEQRSAAAKAAIERQIKAALKKGDLDALKPLVSTKGILHMAIRSENVQAVEFLLGLSDVDFFYPNPYYKINTSIGKTALTPLALALLVTNPEIQEAMVKLLLPVSNVAKGTVNNGNTIPAIGVAIYDYVTVEAFKLIADRTLEPSLTYYEKHIIFHAIDKAPTEKIMTKIRYMISKGMDLNVFSGLAQSNPFEYALKKSAMYTKKGYMELAYLLSQYKPAVETVRNTVVREFTYDLLMACGWGTSWDKDAGYNIRRDILIEFIRNTIMLGEDNNFVKILNIHYRLSELAARSGDVPGAKELMDAPFPAFKQSVKEYLEKLPSDEAAGIFQQIIDERKISFLYYAFDHLELDANTMDARGVPIIFAVINKEYGDPRKPMLNYFMEKTDVLYNLKNTKKEVPLQLYVRKILKKGFQDDNYETLKTMIEKIKEDDMSKEIFNNQNEEGSTVLHYTVAYEKYSKPYYQLLKKYVDPKIKNNDGESIVFSSHKWVYSDLFLYEQLGEVNNEGMSVFMSACLDFTYKRTLEKMRFILNNALHKTFVPDGTPGVKDGTRVLEWLLEKHVTDMCFEPFLEQGLDPNRDVSPGNTSNTVMMQVVDNGIEDDEKLIVKYIDKIDLNKKNGKGYNLLAVIVDQLSFEGTLQDEDDAGLWRDFIAMLIAKGSKIDGVLKLSMKLDLQYIIDIIVTPREHYIYDLERLNKSIKAKCKGYTNRAYNPVDYRACKGYSRRLKKNSKRIKELKQMTDEEYQKMLSLLQAGEMTKCANKEDLILFMPWEAEDYRNTLFLRLEKDGKAMVWCFVNKLYPADPEIPGDTDEEVSIDESIKDMLFANWVNQDGTAYEANTHGRGGTTGNDLYIQMRTSNGAKYYLMYDDLLRKIITFVNNRASVDLRLLDWKLPVSIHAKYEKRVAIANADGSMGVSETHGTRAEDIYVVEEIINLDSRERIDRGKACEGTCLKF